MNLVRRILVSEFLLIFCVIGIVFYALLYAQDPIGPKLDIEGEIELGANKSLRLQPVVGTAPASPQTADLYFNGTALFTYDGTGWQTVSEKGDIFYNDNDSSLYFHNGTTWQKIGSGAGGAGGRKTIASRIVAASNSMDKDTKADYVCNGTNDQNWIEAAINALGTVGGAVYLLEGTYNITADITVAKSNVSLIGAGSGTILKRMWDEASANNTGVITVGDGTNAYEGILISQLAIDGNKVTYANEDNHGIFFKQKISKAKIKNNWIYNNGGYEIYLYALNAANSNSFNLIEGNDARNSFYGIRLNYSSNNIFTGNSVVGNVGSGIHLTYSCGNIITGNNVHNNTGTWGILLQYSSDNNIIYGNNFKENSIGIYPYSSSNNTIAGNVASGNSAMGILLFQSFNNVISGNNMLGNKSHGICSDSSSNNTITSNAVFESSTTGIKLSNSSLNNLISFNNIYDSSGTDYGINIANANCTNNYLVGNPIDGAAYIGAGYDRRITDSGNNTAYTDKNKMTLEKLLVNITVSSYNLDAATAPRSYCALNPSLAVNLTLANGKSEGDFLILENINPTNAITVVDTGNKNLEGNKALGQYDTLEFIWNGARWLQVDWKDN